MPPAPPGPTGPPPGAPRRWHQSSLVVLASLVLCFPVGFVLVLLTRWSPRTKALALAATFSTVVLLSALGSAAAPPSQKVSAQSADRGAAAAPEATAAPTTGAPTTTPPATSTTTTVPPTTAAPPTTVAPKPVPTTSPARSAAPAPTAARPAALPPPAAPVKPAGTCHPSYTPCVPVGSDADCKPGSGNGPIWVTVKVKVIGPDDYGLDNDGDGYGCDANG